MILVHARASWRLTTGDFTFWRQKVLEQCRILQRGLLPVYLHFQVVRFSLATVIATHRNSSVYCDIAIWLIANFKFDTYTLKRTL